MSEESQAPARSDRPNLEQKKKLAKELLKAVRRLDAAQAARFTWNHPRFRGQTGLDVVREGVTLADAQHVIARESGFESWPKLTDYVRKLDTEPDGPTALFENAVRTMIRGDVTKLRTLLRDHPEVATMRSSRHHRAVLPHYLAANGVENEHQISPPNALEVAAVLFEHGGDAVVDATAGFYGEGGGSTPLVGLVTSTHPHEAGVQADLVRAFCDAGANPNGIDDDGLPINSALGFRYPAAAEALVECGARIESLPVAAGLGRIDLVRRYLNPAAGITSASCSFPNPGNEIIPASTAPHPETTLQQALVFACMSGKLDVARLLLENGVDINGGPRRGITAIHESAYQGQIEAVRWLLEQGADPTLRETMWESTAIGWANAGGHPALVDELFRRGPFDFLDAVEMQRHELVRRKLEEEPVLANAPDGRGGALRFAAFHGDLRLAKMLLDAGADPALENESGLSAYDYAKNQGIVTSWNCSAIDDLRTHSGKK